MSLPHFFLNKQVLASMPAPVFTLQLDSDDVKHAKVLHLAAGEHIAVVDATTDYFECEVVSFENGELSVSTLKNCLRIRVLKLFLSRVWLRVTRWIPSLGMQRKSALPNLFQWSLLVVL